MGEEVTVAEVEEGHELFPPESEGPQIVKTTGALQGPEQGPWI